MIANEKQYQITKKKAECFVRAMNTLDANEKEDANVSKRLRQLERNAINAQLTVLRNEIEEYERVKNEGTSI